MPTKTKAKRKKHKGWLVKRLATIRLAKIIDRWPVYACERMAESFEQAEPHIPDVQPEGLSGLVETPKGSICRVVTLLGVLEYYQLRAIENAFIVAIEDGTLGPEQCGSVGYLRLVAESKVA